MSIFHTRTLQADSNFCVFSVTLTDSRDGGIAVPAPSAAAFYLSDADTDEEIVSGSAATTIDAGDNYVVAYRVLTTDLEDVSRVVWQFKVTWANPSRVQWTPREYARVENNLG